jgi:hypothetical protein
VSRVLRWWVLLLVPVGFAAGHELGYTGAAAIGSPAVAAGGHGYLVTLALVGAPFAFAAIARATGELTPTQLDRIAGQISGTAS